MFGFSCIWNVELHKSRSYKKVCILWCWLKCIIVTCLPYWTCQGAEGLTKVSKALSLKVRSTAIHIHKLLVFYSTVTKNFILTSLIKMVSFHVCANIQEHLESNINRNVRKWNLGHSYFKQQCHYVMTNILLLMCLVYLVLILTVYPHGCGYTFKRNIHLSADKISVPFMRPSNADPVPCTWTWSLGSVISELAVRGSGTRLWLWQAL